MILSHIKPIITHLFIILKTKSVKLAIFELSLQNIESLRNVTESIQKILMIETVFNKLLLEKSETKSLIGVRLKWDSYCLIRSQPLESQSLRKLLMKELNRRPKSPEILRQRIQNNLLRISLFDLHLLQTMPFTI